MAKDKDRVVITGIGVVSPIGIGRKNFWLNLSSGLSGVGKITLFEAFDKKCSIAAEVKGINFSRYLGSKGLKWLDRSTKFLMIATQSAFRDARYAQGNKRKSRLGVVVGTDWSCLESNIAFHTLVLRKQHKQVNPMDFPKALTNAASGHVAIKYGLEGLNTTISRGFTSSLDALGYAAEKIKDRSVDLVVAGGVENLSIEFYTIFNKSKKLLADNKGIVLGEGSCIFVLEKIDSAIKRGAHIFAEVLGYGFSFGDNNDAIKRSILSALENSKISSEGVDYIFMNANNDSKKDAQELCALSSVFVGKKDIKGGTIKPQIGECFGAGGAMQVAAACLAFNKGVTPSVRKKKESFYSARKSKWILRKKAGLGVIMVNSFGLDGNNATLILKRV